MEPLRRTLVLALTTLPAACAYRPLPALRTTPAPAPDATPGLRPAALGQRWTYRRYNGFNSALLATEEEDVAAVGPQVRIRRRSDGAPAPEELQQPWGQVLREHAWDLAQHYEPALPLWPADPRAGARSVHTGHYRVDGHSYRYWLNVHTTVAGWEEVALPGTTWHALRVERYIRLQHHDFSRLETTRRDTLWLVPGIGRWVAREVSGNYLVPDDRGTYRGLEAHHRWELVAWS